MLDYEHDPVEAGADRVVNGVFHKDLAVGAEALYLLNAAVARAKPGCHDNNGLVHIFLLFCAVILLIDARSCRRGKDPRAVRL